jgi:cobyrinic acid a,c-diamide synthase
VGIIAALRCLGRSEVAPFKKGPDYIDAGWLALAAGRPCYNLDTFLIDRDTILGSYTAPIPRTTDFTVIEGNRGLYDCIDTKGKPAPPNWPSCWPAGDPVHRCHQDHPNHGGRGGRDHRVRPGSTSAAWSEPGGRQAAQKYSDAQHRSVHRCAGIGGGAEAEEQGFPERHMGLVPTPEHSWAAPAIDAIRLVAEKHLDLEQIQRLAETAIPAETVSVKKTPSPVTASTSDRPTIGILRDSAFQFYYPENLEALEAAGARLVYASPLTDRHLPPVDALYIGGGFPETHARELEQNTTFKNELKSLADNGLPIYAECGGLMYLGEKLELEAGSFEMTGVLPAVFGFSKRPQGHGYTIVQVEKENPYFPIGTKLLGHEFHYSSVKEWKGREENLSFSMQRGAGFIGGKDGVFVNNVLATYTHIHALGTPAWAKSLVDRALWYRQAR